MKILLTGACGFVGSTLAAALLEADSSIQIFGLDNFSRPGSELNRAPLLRRGVKVVYGDVRSVSDLEEVPAIDWVIDAAANPSVLAGVGKGTTSRQLIEHNFIGTFNLLELAKKYSAGFILLSTSRVYSIEPLADLAIEVTDKAFLPGTAVAFPKGVSLDGITEEFSTESPISLYGASKLASEVLAQEYGATFNFPVWINRCGVLAGAGQFGRPDQGIFSYWINSYLRKKPLKYTGFNGYGYQVRDCFHPRDLALLVYKQMRAGIAPKPITVNLGGGRANAMSLAQLSAWCAERFGPLEIESDPASRRFDLPWLVMDSRLAKESWDWQPKTSLTRVLEEIAQHAEEHPDWLEISAAL